MRQYRVNLADEAWAAIESHIRYLAVEQQAPINASRWAERLIAAIDALETMPRRHTLDDGQTRHHGLEVYRMVFERSYLLFYAIDEAAEVVNVLTFRHAARADAE